VWVNLTGGESPKIHKERLYYRRKGVYVDWADIIMVLGPPELSIGSSRV